MFGRAAIALAALSLLGAAPAARAPLPSPEATAWFLSACAERDGWRDAAPPLQIDRNVYLVGTCGIMSVLVTSPKGHVLIDSAEEAAVPLILANVRALGFRPSDIKWLLNTHAHFDHAGGMAAMQAATGATVAALPDQARELESGAVPVDDPQFGLIEHAITPVKVGRLLRDGVPLVIGRNRITPVSTPGHTRGSTSWVIRTCGTNGCEAVVYADSVSTPAAKGYRFTDHPAWTAQFRRGVARIGTLPCSLLIAPHPAQSGLFERLAGKAPLRDSQGCKRYSDNALVQFEQRLAKERVGP